MSLDGFMRSVNDVMGKTAYEGFAHVRWPDGYTPWNKLPPATREAWLQAALAVRELVKPS